MDRHTADARWVVAKNMRGWKKLIGVALLAVYVVGWGWSEEAQKPPEGQAVSAGSKSGPAPQKSPDGQVGPPSPTSEPTPPRMEDQARVSLWQRLSASVGVSTEGLILGIAVVSLLMSCLALVLALRQRKDRPPPVALPGASQEDLDHVHRALSELEQRVGTMEGKLEGLRSKFDQREQLLKKSKAPVSDGRPATPVPSKAPPAEPKPPAEPRPLSELEELIARGPRIPELRAGLQRIADDATHPERETAGVMLAWLVWLTEKKTVLEGLQGSELIDKLRFWQGPLDYYLWANPEEEILLTFKPSPQALEPLNNYFLADLKARQQRLQQFLAEQGIKRIEAVPGSPFVPGVVERSSKPPQPTSDPALHDRVYRVEPGEGGYRFQGHVLMYSLARRYEYRPPDRSNWA